MARKSPYEYEPRYQSETEEKNQNRDPVKLNMTDGSHDPVNDPDPMRHLEDQYRPQYPKN
jgi:hypothetical protein